MRLNMLTLIFFSCIGIQNIRSQELQANVTVLSNRISTSVNKQIFSTLQSALYDFMNGRKWTNVAFSSNEKIQCNFLLNLSGSTDNNTYTATLTVQTGRPIFNTGYQSPLMNYMDESFTFKYIQYQALDFNDNR